MQKLSMYFIGFACLFTLVGCVSEKTFEQVFRQLEDERQANEGLVAEVARLQEDQASLLQEKETLLDKATEERIRADEFLAVIEKQKKQIRSLSKGKKIVRVQKPDMTWARSISDLIAKEFKDEVKAGRVRLNQTDDRLVLSLADSLLFEEDDVAISLDGEDILHRLGSVLSKVSGREIVISGHLDTRPIAKAMRAEFPTAWEFTGTRAIEVVRFLQEESKVDGKSISAVAYGETRPVETNATERGRAQNRRIDVALLP